MYSITDLRKDTLIDLDGIPHRVVEYHHAQLGRGGATVRIKVKNLATGQVLDRTYKNDEKIAPADVVRKKIQYLYSDQENASFMDTITFDQYQVEKSESEDVLKYFPEGAELEAYIYNQAIVSFELPNNTILEVVEAPGADKGNSASGATKVVKMETGISVNAPLFIKVGDKLKVDTRSGDYLQRA